MLSAQLLVWLMTQLALPRHPLWLPRAPLDQDPCFLQGCSQHAPQQRRDNGVLDSAMDLLGGCPRTRARRNLCRTGRPGPARMPPPIGIIA